MKKLQAIQNNALRIIFKKDNSYDIEALHHLLSKRASSLTKKYLNKAELNGDPLIAELLDEFTEYKSSNESKKTSNTLLEYYENLNIADLFNTQDE